MNDFTKTDLRKSAQQEMHEIEEWLSNRPSATMDPCFDEVLAKRARLRELRGIRRTVERRPSTMMASQQMEEDA